MPKGVEAHYIPECSSTNTLAASMAADNPNTPFWVIAGAQTSGRARRGKTWVSEKGNLYASLLMPASHIKNDLYGLPFIVALAVRDVIIKFGCAPDDVQCKWPNDILVRGKKISGILIETLGSASGKPAHVILGIGINLAHYPSDSQFPATSLKDEIGLTVSALEIVSFLAEYMKKRLEAWGTETFDTVRHEWLSHSWGMGEKRILNLHQEVIEATLEDLASDGGLIVRLASGEERTIYAADIFAGLEGE